MKEFDKIYTTPRPLPSDQDYIVTPHGTVYNRKTGVWLKPYINQNGYVIVTLKSKGQCRVHRLVGECFLPADPDQIIINHDDGVKTNNYAGNLEWCTYSHNALHARATNLNTQYGENHECAKFTEAQVNDICFSLQDGCRNIDIAREYNVKPCVVASIRTGRTWKHVAKNYILTKKRVNRLSKDKVVAICEYLQDGLTNKVIGLKVDVSFKEVARIKARTSHSKISNSYKF